MIATITPQGNSFKGAIAYFCHDKVGKTTERIDWTHVKNMMTQSVDTASKVMAYTHKAQDRLKQSMGISNAGRKLEKSVFTYALAWHPEEAPDQEKMMQAIDDSLKKLGLEEHEAVIAAHNDRNHKHAHVVVSKIHPLTGKAAPLKHTKKKLSEFASDYERKHGKIYCQQREHNRQQKEKGMHTKYTNPNIKQSWDQSRTAKEFEQNLNNKGYELAQGRKRIVTVDPYGKTINPVRHLPTVSSQEFHLELKSLGALPTPEEILHKRDENKRLHAQRVKEHQQKFNDMSERLVEDQKVQRQQKVENENQNIRRKASQLKQDLGINQRRKHIKQLIQEVTKKPTLKQHFRNFFLKENQKKREQVKELKVEHSNTCRNYTDQVAQMKKQRIENIHKIDQDHKEERQRLTRMKEHTAPPTPQHILAIEKRENTKEQSKTPTLER